MQCVSNWSYTTFMPKPKYAPVDMISGDFDPNLSLDRARTECRYLQENQLDWELLSWGFDTRVNAQDGCLKSAAQLMQEAGTVIMHGGRFVNYFLPTRGGHVTEDVIALAKTISEYCRTRKEFSLGSIPVPQIGVIYASKSQLRRSERIYAWWGNPLNELEGALHCLLENGYSVSVLAEHQLKSRMREFKALVLPECDTLDEDFKRELIAYVISGGQLMILGARAAALFERELGVELSPAAHVNTTLFSGVKRISANGSWRVPQIVCAQVIAWRAEYIGIPGTSLNMDARASGLSELTSAHIKRFPAATERPLGAGYISAVYTDLGGLYYQNHYPATRELIRDLIELHFEPDVRATGTHLTDVSLRTTAYGALCVHILNTACQPVDKRRAFTDEMPPLYNVDISVRARAKRVKQLPENIELEFERDGDWTRFRVPRLDIHSACVIEECML